MKLLFTQNGIVTGHGTTSTSSVIVNSAIAGTVDYIVDDNSPVDVGWLVDTSTGIPVFAAPPLASKPLTNLTPMQFYLAFTPGERMAIKTSTDPVVVEFWATYQLAVQLNDSINPNLPSIAGAVEYLSITNRLPSVTPEVTYILPSRVAQILAGVAQ